MTYNEFIKEVAHRAEVSQVKTKEIVDALIEVIPDLMCEGERIKLPGVGTLYARQVGERMRRNPSTGEYFMAKAHLQPAIKFSQTLRGVLKDNG